jgi:hypothetical protein
MPRKDLASRDPEDSSARRLSGKVVGWLAVLVVVLVIGVPTALLLGAGDAVFESPREGIATFFGTLVLVAVLLILSYLRERHRDRRSAKGTQQRDE